MEEEEEGMKVEEKREQDRTQTFPVAAGDVVAGDSVLKLLWQQKRKS